MRDKFFVPRKCFRCDYFCLNKRDEKNHNFLTHYQMGGRQHIEDKHLKTKLKRYCINCKDGDYYDFYESRELVSDFLKRVIMNGMTGSSWRFKRFDRICLTVNIDEFRSLGN